ncbi:MAG TPA: PVC-type heme-binding CxxCH protein, partial [Pirellulaceae bacterium]|nr:PVC-type heme-binding CxxCH protein [Pirellulaceae bacterium]
RILMLDDFDPATGKARKITTFFEGTTHTMAIALYHDGSFYVATRMEIFRLRDKDGDGKADERTPICHLDTPGNYPHNGLSDFAFDFAGNVYFGFGENLGAEYKLIGSDGKTLSGGGEGGNIYCCDPEGKNLRRVATGFWNPFALGFDAFGRLFAVDNDPDSRPPCRLLHIVEGGDYGFRFRNGRKGVHPFTAWNGELPGTLPMVAGTGEAPCAVMAYESDNLPEEYRGDLLVTSWGDHRLERYTLRPRGASFGAEMTQVIRGGENFRPVGLALAPDGSLYMSDWVDKSYNVHGKGRVWRISARNPPQRPAFKDAWEALASKHGPTREAALRQIPRVAENRLRAVQVMLQSPDNAVQAAAVRAVDAEDFFSQSLLLGLLGSHPSASVRTAILGHLRASATNNADWKQLELRPEWVKGFSDNRALPPETVAQILAHTQLRSFPLALLYRNVQHYYDRESYGAGLRQDPKFWAVIAQDPFLLNAYTSAIASDIVDAKVTRLRMRQIGRIDSKIAEERLVLALAAKRAGDVELPELVPDLLVDSDLRVQLVGLLWLADENPNRLEPFRWRVESLLKRPNITRQVFEVAVAVLNRIDGTNPDPKNESAGDAFVLKMLLDEKAAPATRRFALRSLRPDHPSLTVEILTKLLADPEESIRLEAIRSLRQRPDSERWPQLREIAADSTAPVQLRCEAILGLSPGNGEDRKLLFELTSCDAAEVADEALRALRGFDLEPDEKEQLTALAAKLEGPRKELAERVLMRNPPKNLPKHEDAEAWLKMFEGPGNPLAGERIFYHLRVGGCFRCHEFEGRGYTIGPDLSTIGRSLTRERLVQSLVDPSREIAPQFTSWAIQTTGGEVLTGIHVGDEVDGRLKFADQNGRVFHVHPNDIDQRKPSSQSIMPEGLVDNLTPQELRDLIAFLLRTK